MKKLQKYFIYSLLTILFFTSKAAFSQYNDPRAAEMLEQVRAHYERSVREIDDYKIVTSNFTTHYHKEYDNGRPYFASKVETESFWGSISGLGMHSTSPMVDADFFSPGVFEHLLMHSRYMGTERIDDLNTHVIFIDDMRVLMEAFDDMDEPIGSLSLFFDDEHWVLRKMKFSAMAEIEEGDVRQIEPVMRMKDYRNIDGLMIPFRTTITVHGLSDYLSDAEREEAMAALEELEKELEQMPAEQRNMLEQMMGGQLDQLRQMLADDMIEFAIEVKEVHVNTGE